MNLTDVVSGIARLRSFSSDAERCIALHDFVRDEIKFGFTSGFESVRPEQTLELKRGHCNAQADLFRALLESAGISAWLRFVELDKEVLRYAVPWPVFVVLPPKLFHAVTEVEVGGRRVRTDSYIFTNAMFQRQRKKLGRSGLSAGFGLREEATCEWDAAGDAFAQAHSGDVNDGNAVYPSLEAALNDKAGNNRLLGIHFNQWLGCIPVSFRRASESYLNSRLDDNKRRAENNIH